MAIGRRRRDGAVGGARKNLRGAAVRRERSDRGRVDGVFRRDAERELLRVVLRVGLGRACGVVDILLRRVAADLDRFLRRGRHEPLGRDRHDRHLRFIEQHGVVAIGVSDDARVVQRDRGRRPAGRAGGDRGIGVDRREARATGRRDTGPVRRNQILGVDLVRQAALETEERERGRVAVVRERDSGGGDRRANVHSDRRPAIRLNERRDHGLPVGEKLGIDRDRVAGAEVAGRRHAEDVDEKLAGHDPYRVLSCCFTCQRTTSSMAAETASVYGSTFCRSPIINRAAAMIAPRSAIDHATLPSAPGSFRQNASAATTDGSVAFIAVPPSPPSWRPSCSGRTARARRASSGASQPSRWA